MDGDAARRAKDRRKREDLLAGLRLEARLREANPPPPARAQEERNRRYDRIAAILRDVDDGSPAAGYVDAQTAQLLRGELARLERARSGDDAASDDDVVMPLVAVERFNTILYCRHWRPTVSFYRDELRLPVIAEYDWFVELRITAGSSLSIADAAKATIGDVGGQGITLSWRVTDLAATRRRLSDGGLEPSDIRALGDASAFYVADPEGHRIEVWSDAGPDVSAS